MPLESLNAITYLSGEEYHNYTKNRVSGDFDVRIKISGYIGVLLVLANATKENEHRLTC